jgi:hypothetical protein
MQYGYIQFIFKKLTWYQNMFLVNVSKMGTNQIPEVLLSLKFDSQKRIPISITRLITGVENNLRIARVRNWRQKAEDRIEW